MKHGWMAAAVVALAAGAASAQIQSLDFGVASEVVRGMMTPRNALEIQQSTNLLSNYRDLALQQELAQEAFRRGLAERIDVQRRFEAARREILIRALQEDVVRGLPTPPEDEVKKAYEARAKELILSPAYQLDVWMVANTDTATLAKARAFATGKAVADETVSVLSNNQVQVQSDDRWFDSTTMASNVWAGLQDMQQNEVRTFPEGTNATIVVRRGTFRGQRQLTLDEARSVIVNELATRKANEAWNEFIQKKRKTLGVGE